MLYLLRHGETEWSRTGRHTGRTDVGLTATGETRAAAAGRVLTGLLAGEQPTLVLSSPRSRATRTAQLAGLTVDETTEQIAEWDYGEYEGATTPEIRETVPGWTVWTHPCPGGETAADVAARATVVIERVRAVPAVVLVGHGHFSRVLIATWLGLPPTAGVHFRLDAASVSVLGDERGAPQLRQLNLPPSPDRQ